MSRSPVHLRPATDADVPALCDVWASLTVRGKSAEDILLGVKRALARADANADERIVVAEHAGQFAGAIHLTRTQLTPLADEPCVRVSHLAVADGKPADAVGRSLLEAAVAYAEETGVSHVLASAASANRDLNRFMARLGLGQVSVVRVATTSALRSKLPAESAGTRVRAQLRQREVLAARRTLRRQRTAAS